MTNTPVALITGASGTLGSALARAFAANGHAVALHAFNRRAEADVLVREISASGGAAAAFSADVRDSAQINRLFADVMASFGRIDVLVNNAGAARDRSLAKMTDEEWRDCLAVNLDGAFYATRAAVLAMRKRKAGLIVNVLSYLAFRPSFGAANYAAAKAGLAALTKAVALEEARNNIRCIAVLPGFHVSGMNEAAWKKHEPEIRAQHLLPKLPDAARFADFVCQLAGHDTITGQIFPYESRLI